MAPLPPGGGTIAPRSPSALRNRVVRFTMPFVIALGGAAATYAGVGEGFAGSPSLSQLVATGLTACITYLGAVAVADGSAANPVGTNGPSSDRDIPPVHQTVALCYPPGERTWADWTANVLVRAGFTVLRRGGPPPRGEGLEHAAQQLLDGADGALILVPEVPPEDLARYTDWLNRSIAAHAQGKSIGWIRHGSLDLWDSGRTGSSSPLDALPHDAILDLSSEEPDVAASTLVTRLHRLGLRPGGAVTDVAILATGLSYPAWGAAVTNLPPRNPHFTDRDTALATLSRCLLSDDGGPRPDAGGLVGLPGVGKTQTALEFGHRFASHYDVVWWVNAERPVSLSGQLAELARALGAEEVPDLTVMLSRLWTSLRERSRWLLVYDNVEQPPDISTIWPRASNGDVLITSRNPNWGSLGVTRVLLNAFDADDGVAFLLKRTRESDHDAARAVTIRLGGLPFALEHVGAYVEERRASLAGYRALLGEGPRNTSSAADTDWYASAMATSWNVSFDQANDENPHVRPLLSVFSYLAPDDIPRGLVPDHISALGEALGGLPTTRAEYDRAVAVLVRLSLIDATEDRITIHRLAQEYVLSRMTGPEEQRWAVCSALTLVGAAFPLEPLSPSSWVTCRRVMPHVLELTESRAAHYPLLRERCAAVLGSLLLRAGRYLHLRGEHGPARGLLEQALDVESSRAEPDPLANATVLAALGRVYYHQAELADARRVTQQAIAAAVGELGEHDEFVGRLRLHLSRILRELTVFDEAEHLAGEVLEHLRRSDGERTPLVAEAWATYGDALWRRGRLREAADAYSEALDVRSALPGTPAIDMATCHKHLGIISRELDDLDVAEQELRTARTLLIADYGADYGENHRDVIDVDGHLAEVLRRSGRLEEAYGLLRRVVAVREEEFEDHPDVAGSLTKLGALLRDQGRYEESESVLSRAVAMFERCMGIEHPYVADAAVERALTRRAAGDGDGAVADADRAVSVYAARFAAGHPDLERAERVRRDIAP
ncbi:FxSxx-COOH system tetratricopeptide repeat protein [Streptomyces fructofermentans]|uniref:FxSxx-COOH system tetratricopeptide repeat protein n=1 Tax=Streptomyces fructofermentans TaxID=152141 RepID=UPI0037BAA863